MDTDYTSRSLTAILHPQVSDFRTPGQPRLLKQLLCGERSSLVFLENVQPRSMVIFQPVSVLMLLAWKFGLWSQSQVNAILFCSSPQSVDVAVALDGVETETPADERRESRALPERSELPPPRPIC